MSYKSERILEGVGNQIDILSNVDVRYRNVIPHLFEGAKKEVGGSLTMEAAKILKKAFNNGGVAIIVTGFPVLAWLLDKESVIETDGPPGVAVLARAIDKGFDAIPVILTTKRFTEHCKVVCQGAGLIETDLDRTLKSKPSPKASATSVIDFPSDKKDAEKLANELIDKLDPKVLISIEQPGQNEKGIYHYGYGREIPAEIVANADTLFKEARSRGIPTIGIGDGGNELGMGNIQDTVKRYVPFGSKCECPCKSGIAASTEVDLTITAAISNWGAYGIAATISALTDKPEAFPMPNVVKGALEGCARAGVVDGVTGMVQPTEDGVSINVTLGFLEIMRSIIEWSKKGVISFIGW